MEKFIVNIGNIGNIPCKTAKSAEKTFLTYVKQSNTGKGRAAGEDVTLIIDGEPVKEHFGKNRRNN